ncbi:MAG: hypothetical protein M1817_006073 [Caeruleum heppii]|nr:MAG: hypothetical protein M1817_006073 [Caeruleum heppii]
MSTAMYDDTEVDVLHISQDLVDLPQLKAAGTRKIDFDGLLSTPLILHEDLTEGCGGQLWPAGMVLSRYLLRTHQTQLEGKSIIELGAGGGLVGSVVSFVRPIRVIRSAFFGVRETEINSMCRNSLAVALGCNTSKPIYITDQQPMLALMQKNISLNGLDGQVVPEILDWGHKVSSNIPRPPNIILAADCVYFEPAFPLLQETLLTLAGSDTIIYFCFKKRRKADLQFMRNVRKVFEVREVEDDPNKERYRGEKIFL